MCYYVLLNISIKKPSSASIKTRRKENIHVVKPLTTTEKHYH